MLGKQGYFFGLSHLLAAFDTMCQRLIEHVLKILLQDIHIIADLGVGDSGIELGDLDIGVTKHLRYWFDRHTVFEGDGGRKSVAGRVEVFASVGKPCVSVELSSCETDQVEMGCVSRSDLWRPTKLFSKFTLATNPS